MPSLSYLRTKSPFYTSKLAKQAFLCSSKQNPDSYVIKQAIGHNSACLLAGHPGVNRPTSKAPVSNKIIVTRIISALDAIERASRTFAKPRMSPINAIIYPTVVAALEIEIMNLQPAWKVIVKRCLDSASQPILTDQTRLLLGLIEEQWQRKTEAINIDTLLRERGIELSLL